MSLGRLQNEQDLTNFVRELLDKQVKPIPQPPQFLTAALPAAADVTGLVVYVTDAAAGSKLQYSDGTAWIAFA